MPRIPYPDPASLNPTTQAMLQALPALNLVRLMAHAEGTLDAVMRLSDGVLNRGVLDPILRQVALIRLCVVAQSPYEGRQIEHIATAGLAMDDVLIAAAREGSTSLVLDDLQRGVARLAEELAAAPRPSPETFEFLAAKLSAREFAELVQGIGFYLMQSRFIETFALELEEPPVDIVGRNRSVDPQRLAAWREGRTYSG